MQEGLRLNERDEAEEARKLATLRVAAQIGLATLKWGESRLFIQSAELANYLDEVADRVLAPPGPD